MPNLVLHTFGILEHHIGHPASQTFVATSPGVVESTKSASGLLKSEVNTFEPVGTTMNEVSGFGTPVTPQFHDLSQDRYGLVTLSIWTDAESAAGFSYHGTHGAAMKRRTEWFNQDHSWPTPENIRERRWTR